MPAASLTPLASPGARASALPLRALDTVREVPTSEGIELSLRPAGPVPRAYAWMVDFLIRLAILLVLSIGLGIAGQMGQGVFLLVWFLLEWFYPVSFEVWGNGATPGKRAFGLAVLQDDGTPVTFAASLTRNLLRFADFLPFLYAFGLVSMLLTRDSKRLGDLAAGTVVVYREKATSLPDLPDLAGRAPLAPPLALDAAEARAVIDFAARSQNLAPARAEELAQSAGLLVGHAPDPALQLVRMAHHLSGKVAPVSASISLSNDASRTASQADLPPINFK